MKTVKPSSPERASGRLEPSEILIPHDPDAGRLVAVRNVLIQASIAGLKAHGHYDRYIALVEPRVLTKLLEMSLSPGWIGVELAVAHYEACDDLWLTDAQFEQMGKGVGDRVQDTMLVSLAKKVREANFDLWQAVGPLHRMWPRVFQGGSVQVYKTGPREQVLEERGYVLNRYHYYRQAHRAALTSTYEALGANATVNIVTYSAARDEMIVRVAWT